MFHRQNDFHGFEVPNLKARPRQFSIFDYFLAGNASSGSIGKLGWNLLGVGTPAVTRLGSQLDNAQKLTLATSAANNDRSSLLLSDAENKACIGTTSIQTAQCVWHMRNSLTSKRVFFGFATNFATNPPANANTFGILYDSGIGPNYQLLSRRSGVGDPVDTGVAVPANSDQLVTIENTGNPNEYRFWVGTSSTQSVLLGTISVSSSFGGNVGWRLETLTTAAAEIGLGYFGFNSRLVGGVFSTDDFLGGL